MCNHGCVRLGWFCAFIGPRLWNRCTWHVYLSTKTPMQQKKFSFFYNFYVKSLNFHILVSLLAASTTGCWCFPSDIAVSEWIFTSSGIQILDKQTYQKIWKYFNRQDWELIYLKIVYICFFLYLNIYFLCIMWHLKNSTWRHLCKFFSVGRNQVTPT